MTDGFLISYISQKYETPIHGIRAMEKSWLNIFSGISHFILSITQTDNAMLTWQMKG